MEDRDVIDQIFDELHQLSDRKLEDVLNYIKLMEDTSDEEDDSSEYDSNNSDDSNDSEENVVDVNSEEYQKLVQKLSSIKLPSLK